MRTVSNLSSFGVTYDSELDKIYWGGDSRSSRIYRANRDGSNVETLTNNTECAELFHLFVVAVRKATGIVVH